MSGQNGDLREQVRAHYAAAAVQVTQGGAACCGSERVAGAEVDGVEVDESFGAGLYAAEDRAGLPVEAIAASLGCGNPLAVAELREGERVLDLGSGGGIDVLLSARRVGRSGKAYGVDMTEEMLALALANAKRAGAANVEFLKGTIESVPLPAGTVDVVISNCVINLSVDKTAVFAEIFRVLAPGGRIGVCDIVAEDHLTADERAERGDHVGCIAGALSFAEYREGLGAAGFTDIEIATTLPHALGSARAEGPMVADMVADGMHSAIVRAVKPVANDEARGSTAVPIAEPGACCGASSCCR